MLPAQCPCQLDERLDRDFAKGGRLIAEAGIKPRTMVAAAQRLVVAIDPVLGTGLDELSTRLTAMGHHVVRVVDPGEPQSRTTAPYQAIFAQADIIVPTVRMAHPVHADGARLRAVIYPTIGTESIDLAIAGRCTVLVGMDRRPRTTTPWPNPPCC